MPLARARTYFQFHTIQLLFVRDRENFMENEERQTKLYACSLEKFYLSFVQYNRITIHLEGKKIHVENFSVHKWHRDGPNRIRCCSHFHFHFHLQTTLYDLLIWPMQMLHMLNEILIIPSHTRPCIVYVICCLLCIESKWKSTIKVERLSK